MMIKLIMLFIALFVTCGGVDKEEVTKDEVQQVEVVDEEPPYNEFGVNLYIFHCASCHGINGKGDGTLAPATKYPIPKFNDNTYVWKTGFKRYNIEKYLYTGDRESGHISYSFLEPRSRFELADYIRYLRWYHKGKLND